jgi:glycosyltransferase involved in cell wall biosynthesis
MQRETNSMTIFQAHPKRTAPLRVAQVAPLSEAVPPKTYGGTERVVSWLTEGLVALGHDVTLFASADSITSAKLEACSPVGLRLGGIKDHTASHLVMLERVRRMRAAFDIVHFHIDLLQFPRVDEFDGRCLTTMHGRLDVPDFLPVYEAFPTMPLISISQNQRAGMSANVNWFANIPHGLPPEVCRFSPKSGDYLAFLGRLCPEKAPERAIAIAKAAGVPLKIAAKVDPADRIYFEESVKPLLNHPLIEFIGEINEEQKAEFLGNAAALLFPIDWPEPFGLVMIEPMSCGTPVIAWNRGSVPEVIDHGVSGYIVDNFEDAVSAVHAARGLAREDVRRCFERRFTAQRMVEQHIVAYEKLLALRSARDIAWKAPASSAVRSASGPALRNVAPSPSLVSLSGYGGVDA